MTTIRRIPSLDGLRAISILVVSLSHVNRAFPGSPFWRALDFWGSHGVDVFFVISGYLITYLLLKEKRRFGTISLKTFYLRRVQRIFPAYYFFLLVALVLLYFGVVHFDVRDELKAITYTYNFFPHKAAPVLGIVWSLCVEEHFYLLWPATVLLFKPRNQIRALIFVILLAIPFRYWLEVHRSPLDPGRFTLTRLDTIAVGCLFAILLDHPRSAERLRTLLHKKGILWISLYAYIASTVFLARSGKYHIFFQSAVEAALLAVIMGTLVERPHTAVGKLLNAKPVVYVGLLSYAIYLGQFCIVNLKGVTPFFRFVLLATYALFSFYVVESPVLALSRKYRRVETLPEGSEAMVTRLPV